MTIAKFLSKLGQLNRAPWNGGKAPHKPVLLLSVADWFEKHQPISPLVPVDEDLVNLFKENWQLLVSPESYSPVLITQPFYYLKSEGFWTPMLGNGNPMEVQLKSIKRLFEENAAVQLSVEVFLLFQQPVSRELIRMKLLDAFFPTTKQCYIEAKGLDGLILDIEADILKEPSYAPRYGRIVQGMKEREGFIRDQKFADNLLYQYDYTCCITGLWVENATMVEACHIKPHYLCGINSLDNGLALCPNLHCAFDVGLISLTDDYKVIIKEKLVESNTTYSLKALEGKNIRLPKEERFWPGREWIRWQRENIH